MELNIRTITISLVLIQQTIPFVKSQRLGNAYKDDLAERMEKLELREVKREHDNAELKQRVLALENIVEDQHNQIQALQETINKQDDTNEQLYKRVQYLETRDQADESNPAELHSQKERIEYIERFIQSLRAESRNEESQKKSVTKIERRKNSKTRRRNEENVAFFAYLDKHIQNPGVHQIVAFDHVTTNIGNGYNAFAGDFRAPVAGTYVFAATLMSGDFGHSYHFMIMHNAQQVSKIYIPNGGTASQEVVIQLKQGDNVSIHNIDAGQVIYGSGYSTFSGFLLQQNFSSPAIVGR